VWYPTCHLAINIPYYVGEHERREDNKKHLHHVLINSNVSLSLLCSNSCNLVPKFFVVVFFHRVTRLAYVKCTNVLEENGVYELKLEVS